MAANEDRETTITVPGAPAVPGLRFRHLYGASDYAALAALRQACALEDAEDEMPTAADIANFIENPVDNDPARDLILGEAENALVAADMPFMSYQASVQDSGCARHLT